MSADNWAICPKCVAEANSKRALEERRVSALYGQVPVGEFDKARAALVSIDPEKLRTFREDYEIYGAEDGEIVVGYSGSCATCGLSVSFKHTKPFYPDR